MNFDTNFLRAEHQADRWTRIGTRVALAVAIGAGVWLAGGMFSLHSEARGLDEKLAELATSLDAAQREYEERLARLPEGIGGALEALSAVPTYGGDSTAALLYELEKRLPRDIHLTRLRHDRAEGSVMLEARTREGRQVSRLLKKLEEIEGISRVRMLGQESAKDGMIAVRVSFRQVRDNAAVQ